MSSLETGFNQLLVEAQAIRTRIGAVRDRIVKDIYSEAREIAAKVVQTGNLKVDRDRKIDDLVTSKIWGYPLMLALLSLVFWLTISGANFPSALLADLLFGFQDRLSAFFSW